MTIQLHMSLRTSLCAIVLTVQRLWGVGFLPPCRIIAINSKSNAQIGLGVSVNSSIFFPVNLPPMLGQSDARLKFGGSFLVQDRQISIINLTKIWEIQKSDRRYKSLGGHHIQNLKANDPNSVFQPNLSRVKRVIIYNMIFNFSKKSLHMYYLDMFPNYKHCSALYYT